MADVKISELTAAEAATADDLVVIVDDPAGTPSTKKLTIAELATAVAGDKLPLAGGTMTGAILFGTGGQNLNVGSFDNSTGGSSGISLVCAVGYELNWQGGHLSSSTSAGATNYDILCDSSITLAAGKRLTFGDATYIDTAPPAALSLAGGNVDAAALLLRFAGLPRPRAEAPRAMPPTKRKPGRRIPSSSSRARKRLLPASLCDDDEAAVGAGTERVSPRWLAASGASTRSKRRCRSG